MRRLIIIGIFMLFFMGMTNAQEKSHKNIQLVEETTSQELLVKTDFTTEKSLGVAIFKTATKQKGDIRIDDRIEILPGEQITEIDLTQLPAGEYFVEIYENGVGRLFRTTFIKQ